MIHPTSNLPKTCSTPTWVFVNLVGATPSKQPKAARASTPRWKPDMDLFVSLWVFYLQKFNLASHLLLPVRSKESLLRKKVMIFAQLQPNNRINEGTFFRRNGNNLYKNLLVWREQEESKPTHGNIWTHNVNDNKVNGQKKSMLIALQCISVLWGTPHTEGRGSPKAE